MPHRAFRFAPLFGLLLAPAVAAQAPKDRVYFRDRATDKTELLDGEAVDTAFGVKFTGADKKERLFPATDLVRVEYGALDPAVRQAAGPLENDRDPAKPLAYYVGKLKDLPANAPEKTKRFFQFREAYWTGRAADAKAAPAEFQTEGKKAADKMLAAARANPKTWEQWPLARAAARTYAELGDVAAADDALKLLAAVTDAPAEMRADAALQRVGYLLQAGKYSEAKAALADAEKSAAGPTAERAAIYKEALAVLPAKESGEADAARAKPAATKIEALIAKAKEPAVRATGYAALGEVYLAHRLDRDALWSFLWVDTVYFQDKDEQVRAVRRLIELFDKSGEKDGEKSRADQFRDKLPKVR